MSHFFLREFDCYWFSCFAVSLSRMIHPFLFDIVYCNLGCALLENSCFTAGHLVFVRSGLSYKKISVTRYSVFDSNAKSPDCNAFIFRLSALWVCFDLKVFYDELVTR